MIPVGLKIYLGVEPIDLRWGYRKLSGIVKERMGVELQSPAIFLFYGRQRRALRVLYHDGTGTCLFSKSLDRGFFRLPELGSEGVSSVVIEEEMLEELLDGIHLEESSKVKRSKKRLH